jgi:hypothetical protein
VNIAMLVLLLIALPIATAALIGAVRLLRPGFAYHWLLAVIGSLLAWILAWLVRPATPLNLPLANWQPRIFLPISPALLLDSKSWPFALALTSLALAALTTDLARPATSRRRGYWFDLIAYLLLTAFSMLAALSGNLITLLLTWSLLAGLEFFLRLSMSQESGQSNGAVAALAIRFASTGCLIVAGMVAYAAGSPLSFTTIAPQVSPILLAAAGIGLGVFPIHSPIPRDDPKSAALNTLLRIAPSAPALVLLARVGMAGVPANLEVLFLLLAGWALIYAGLAWGSAASAQAGLAYWVLGLAALALASAALGQSAASLAWGAATLFTGGLFSLATARLRGLALLWLLGLASISALPFSPTWAGAGLYALPLQPMVLILLAGQGLFLAGTLRQALRLPPALSGAERWVGSLYLSGLLLLLVSHFTGAWITRQATQVIGQYQIGWIETGISMVALGLAVVLTPLYLRRRSRQPGRLSGLKTALELAWLYRLLGAVYRGLENAVAAGSSVLEGRAGILWTLLALALLVSLFASLGLGG